MNHYMSMVTEALSSGEYGADSGAGGALTKPEDWMDLGFREGEVQESCGTSSSHMPEHGCFSSQIETRGCCIMPGAWHYAQIIGNEPSFAGLYLLCLFGFGVFLILN